MIYLLDVNALIALGFHDHDFHERVAAWVRAENFPVLTTCSITELGFVRVLAQAAAYGLTVSQARTLLLQLKESGSLSGAFLADTHDVSHLPGFVETSKRVTDGHLLQLAKANGAVLATLDGKIPGAYLIPRGE